MILSSFCGSFLLKLPLKIILSLLHFFWSYGNFLISSLSLASSFYFYYSGLIVLYYFFWLFFIFWFPHNLTVILFNVAPLFDIWIKTPQDILTFLEIGQIGKVLCYLNSCQNFIVCLIFNKSFRDAIADILTLGRYKRKELFNTQHSHMSSTHRTQEQPELTRMESLREKNPSVIDTHNKV